jgi:hypothetical protein
MTFDIGHRHANATTKFRTFFGTFEHTSAAAADRLDFPRHELRRPMAWHLLASPVMQYNGVRLVKRSWARFD